MTDNNEARADPRILRSRTSQMTDEAARAKVERYLNARDFMGAETDFIDDQEAGASDGDPVVELTASALRALLADHAALSAKLVESEAREADLLAIVQRVADGEWSDEGHTALRDLAALTLKGRG
jgi:hypothetical protein